MMLVFAAVLASIVPATGRGLLAQQVAITGMQAPTTFVDEYDGNVYGLITFNVQNKTASSVQYMPDFRYPPCPCRVTNTPITLAGGATGTFELVVGLSDDLGFTGAILTRVNGVVQSDSAKLSAWGDASSLYGQFSLYPPPPPPPPPTYTPSWWDVASSTLPANGTRSSSFSINNIGNASATYTLDVSCTGVLASCIFGNASATTTLTVAAATSAGIAVGFNTGAVGSSGQIRVIATAPPRPGSGVVDADTTYRTVNAADQAYPTISISPFSTITNNGMQVVTRDTATITIDFCDSDGTLGTPFVGVDGGTISSVSLQSTSVTGCFTSKRGTYFATFGDGAGTVFSSVSDGYHTVSGQAWYQFDGSQALKPQITAIHPTVAVPAWFIGTDTFVVANPGRQSATYHLELSCSGNPNYLPCSTSANDEVVLAGGASIRIPVYYGVGGVGSTRTANLSAWYGGAFDTTFANNHFTATVVGTLPPTITISPTTGTTVTSSPIPQVRIDWCDADDALVQHDVNWQGQLLPDTYVATTRSGCVTAGTSTYNNLAISLWQQSLVVTATDVAGHVTTSTTTYTYLPPLENFKPVVTTRPSWRLFPRNGSFAVADTFTIANPGPFPVTYALSALCGGATTISNCQVSPGSASLEADESTTAIVTYTRSGAPDVRDTLKLAATYTSPLGGIVADTGRRVIFAPSTEVAPILWTPTGSFEVLANSFVSGGVSLTNPGSGQVTYTVSQVATTGYVNPFGPFQIVVDPGATQGFNWGLRAPTTVGVTGHVIVTVSYVTTEGVTISRSINGFDVTTIGQTNAAADAQIDNTEIALPPAMQSIVRVYVRNSGSGAGTFNYSLGACSGDAIAQCSALSKTAATLAANQLDTVSLTVTTTSGIGHHGSIPFSVNVNGITRSVAIPVTTGASNAGITIVANSLNAGTSIARNECLTIAAGTDGAYECGDLRLAHALPSTTTMNRTRTPALIYNSAHANPVTFVAVDVTIDATICASEITAIVSFPELSANDTSQRHLSWGTCGQQATRRIIVPVSHANRHQQGAYRYNVEVIVSKTDGTTASVSETGGIMAVVDRSASHFGSGWWLDGVEQLVPVRDHPNELLWIGGDGSTRLYSLISSNVFMVQPAVDRPDSLLKVSSNEYRRLLGNGAYVRFDGNLRHVATMNSLRQETQFNWSGDQLNEIVLPLPPLSSTRLAYTFGYSGSLLTSVTAPPVARGARITTLSRNGNDLAISDAGSVAVHYSSDGLGRITTRTDRLGHATAYTYGTSASVLTQVSVALDGESPLVSSFCPAEVASIEACASGLKDANKVRTWFDGPRRSFPDTTAFYLTRFGAPKRIVDAVGHQTVIDRTDPNWPMRPTLTVDALGHRVSSTYDPVRGLPRTVVDENLLAMSAADGVPHSTTTYTWEDNACNEPTMITSPTGQVTRLTYNHPNCTRQTQQDGRGPATTVTFSYDGLNRLERITYPNSTGDHAERFDYDATLGNLWIARTPLGVATTTERGLAGEVRNTIQPIDSTAAGSVSTVIERDILGRDSVTITTGPRGFLDAFNHASYASGLLDVVTIRKYFDAESRLDSLKREMSPSSNGIGALVTRWSYDAIGRKRTEISPPEPAGSSVRETYTYGDGVNLTSLVTRNGESVTMQYDTLNHLVRKSLPATGTTTSLLGTISVAAQTDSFAYDALGRMTAAINPFAKVHRTYTLGGLLNQERQEIAAADLTFGQHDYQIGYQYDLAGRRVHVDYPSSLSTPFVQGDPIGSLDYSYDEGNGQLKTITMPNSKVFTYSYDDRGRLTSVLLPNGVRDIRQYDEDDRNTALIQRAPATNLGWTPSRQRQTGDTIRADFIKNRDLLGRATFVSIYDDDIHMAYNGSGPLSAYTRIHLAANQAPDDEQYRVDPLGNIAETLVDGGTPRDTNAYDPLSGRIRWMAPRALTGPSMAFDYDQAGNQKYIERARLAPALNGQQMLLFTNTQFAYDATGKLRKSSMRPDVSKNGGLAPADEDTYNDEETRYDALGRRVWVRSYHAAPQFAAASPSLASVTRFVWDGDQVLGEFRMPVTQQENDLTPIFTWMPIPDSLGLLHRGDGSDSVQTYSWMWGRSIYVHGLGIDQPIAIFRAESGDSATLFDPFVMYPLTDWRGNVSSVSFADGSPLRFGNLRATPPLPTEQNSELTAYRQRGASTWTVSSWVGSLINGQFGASGLEYRRNRYYDPQQGRFTQEDPIGLAGGMNLYGFAGGDPVNFNDPFGLCPPGDEECEKTAKDVQTTTERVQRRVRQWNNAVQAGDEDESSQGHLQQLNNDKTSLQKMLDKLDKCDDDDQFKGLKQNALDALGLPAKAGPGRYPTKKQIPRFGPTSFAPDQTARLNPNNAKALGVAAGGGLLLYLGALLFTVP